MATTKKRTATAAKITAAKPVTRAKDRSASKAAVSTRSNARREAGVAPIVRFTPEQRAAYLEREVQSAVGMSVAEFRRAFAAGELDSGDMDVFSVTALLGIGISSRNGSKAVA